jgi:hypothetical protein
MKYDAIMVAYIFPSEVLVHVIITVPILVLVLVQ